MPLLQHSQLVTAGYPWVVIPVERREEYMAALEKIERGGGCGEVREVYWEFDVRVGVFFLAQNLTNGKRFVFLHY